MKNIIELLKKRRSIRKYTNKPISRDKLLSCIEAARLSPSACNIQPWEFVIIDDEKLRNKLTKEAFKSTFYPNQFARKAPVIIVVLAKPDKTVNRMAGYIHGKNYFLFDIGIACSNLILKAYELNVGSCIMAWFDKEKVREILKIPNIKKIVALISLGYFKKNRTFKKNRKNINKIVKFNSYIKNKL